MGEAGRQGVGVDRLRYGEGSKRSERSEKPLNEWGRRVSHVSGSESLTGGTSSARMSVGSDGKVLGQPNREEAEGAGRRQGSARWKAGEDVRNARVGDGEKASDSRLLDSAGMRGSEEPLRLSNGSTSKQSSLSAGKGRMLQDEEGGHRAEGYGSQRSRRESTSEHHAEPDDAAVVHRGGSASARLSERSSEVSVAISSKVSGGDGMGLFESSGSMQLQSSRSGSRRGHASAEGEGVEGCNGDVGEESSMHPRNIFASQLSSSAGDVRNVRETLSSSGRGSTGGSGSSMGEAGRQGVGMDSLSFGKGSRMGEGTEKHLKGEGVRLSHVSVGDSLDSSAMSTRTSLSSVSKNRGLSSSGRYACESVDLHETDNWRSAQVANVGSSKTAPNTPTTSHENVDSSVLRVSEYVSGAKAQTAKSRGGTAEDLPWCSASEDEELQSRKGMSGRVFSSQLSTNARAKAAGATPIVSNNFQTPRLGLDEKPMLQKKANMGNLKSRTTQQARESGNILWEKTTMNFSESSALDNLAHGSCNSPEILASVLNSAMTSSKAASSKIGIRSANKALESGSPWLLSAPGERGSWELARESSHDMTESKCPGHSRLQRSSAAGEGFVELQTRESTTGLDTSRLIAQQDGSKGDRSRFSRREDVQQTSDRASARVGSKKTSSNSRTSTATCFRRSSSSFRTAKSTESSFASAETMTPGACRSDTNGRKSDIASVGDTTSNEIEDVESARLRAQFDWRHANAGRPKNSDHPVATYSRPSYIDGTAMGRRLTAQNNMWSRVGSYEPLSATVFHGVFPTLSSELQKLCMQCVGTPDSPELRSLTDIQKAAMALVAKQSVRKSVAAKSRIATEFMNRGQPKEALEQTEQFLLTSVPILIYFDIASLTPHLAQGGYYRSHFEIPQTDATYLRKCNEREQALYSGLYEHESVRPEHHPKYGYVSMNCVIQPPWEPQSGEACLILKDHVRVRTTISASPKGAESGVHLDHEPRVATLNNPWHVLEALGYDALVALAACTRNPSAKLPPEISGLIDCNIHGEVKLGKDVDAIAVPMCSAHDRAMVSKLQSVATRYMVPLISMEHFPRAVKDDSWKHVLRHLQHEVLLKKTSLGNTYGQI
ncbi:hypothetical protein Esti_006168 [Eimeria stiedai]